MAIAYLLVGLISLLISVAISRWIFRINTHIKNQEIMIDLLGQMLLRQGYSVEEIKGIMKKHQ